MNIDITFKGEQNVVCVLNGYVDPYKRHLYKANRRVTKFRIESLDSAKPFSFEEELEDVVHVHQIDLPQVVTKVRLTILEYCEGEKYTDLCIQMINTRFEFDVYESYNRSAIQSGYESYFFSIKLSPGTEKKSLCLQNSKRWTLEISGGF